MSGKDARRTVTRIGKWKARLIFALTATALLAVCVAIRYSGNRQAKAQSPSPQPAANRPAAPSSAPSGQAAGPQQELRVMADVNGELISRDDLARECLRRYGKDVIESLVNKQLILEECQRRGIVVSEEDILNEIETTAKKFGLNTDTWLSMLHKERNLSAEHYKRDIVWPTIALRRLAKEDIQVTQQEIDRVMESEFGPQVEVRVITIANKQQAENLHTMAKANPAEFGKLAKQYSTDPGSASVRGVIPPIRRNVGNPEIERAAFGLKKGEISPVIQVGDQFLILKCERHLAPQEFDPDKLAIARSKLIERIQNEKMRAVSAKVFEALRNRAEVIDVYTHPQLRQQEPGVAAIVNGRKLPMNQLGSECIARNGLDVLEGEIHRKLLEQELKRRRLAVTQQDIDAEVARAAETYGFLKEDMTTPDVQAWLKEVTAKGGATVDLYVADAVWPSVALKKLVEGDVRVTEDDLKKGFEANFGERVEVLAIVLGSQRQAQKVWDMARNNPTEEFFGELARQYSIETHSRNNAGAVPPIHKHSGQPLVEEEAYRLKPGELSSVISTGGRHIIMKCIGRTKPVVKDFNAVKAELAKDIHEKKLRLEMARKFDELKEGARLDNFLAGTSQAGRIQKTTSATPASANRTVTQPRR